MFSSRIKDITGHRYNMVTVLSFSHTEKGTFHAKWNCRCDCGREFVTKSNWLRTARIISCGCKRRCRNGRSQSAIYQIWKSLQRKGMPLCEAWKDFETFADQFPPHPGGHVSVLRLNETKPLGPDNIMYRNCNDKPITINGVTQSLADWARCIGMSRQALWARINQQGWTPERAVTTPLQGSLDD